MSLAEYAQKCGYHFQARAGVFVSHLNFCQQLAQSRGSFGPMLPCLEKSRLANTNGLDEQDRNYSAWFFRPLRRL